MLGFPRFDPVYYGALIEGQQMHLATTNAFGNALGNSIVGQMKYNALPPDTKKEAPEKIALWEGARMQAMKDHPDATDAELDDYARDASGAGSKIRFRLTGSLSFNNPDDPASLAVRDGTGGSTSRGPYVGEYGSGTTVEAPTYDLFGSGVKRVFEDAELFSIPRAMEAGLILDPRYYTHEKMTLAAFGLAYRDTLDMSGPNVLRRGVSYETLLSNPVPGDLMSGAIWPDMPEGIATSSFKLGMHEFLGTSFDLNSLPDAPGPIALGQAMSMLRGETYDSHYGAKQWYHSMSWDPRRTNADVSGHLVGELSRMYEMALRLGPDAGGFHLMGSILHTIQDSYSMGHVLRDPVSGQIETFYNYNGDGQHEYHRAYDLAYDKRMLQGALAASTAALHMFKTSAPVASFNSFLQNGVYAVRPGYESNFTNWSLSQKPGTGF